MRKEQRKHVTQMTQSEINFVEAKLRLKRAKVSASNLHVSFHAKERLLSRTSLNVTLALMIDTIKDSSFQEYKIIRYNGKISDIRVLLRSNKSYSGKQIILVYSLMSNAVATGWVNSTTDNHSTLDFSLYDSNMKIIGAV